jgi:hypothetical protein
MHITWFRYHVGHVTKPSTSLTTMSYYPQPSTSYSPPPLQHPIPTHPPAAPPEPPATPGSPSGYMRFTSNPASPGQQYAQTQTSAYGSPQYGQPQWQSFAAVPTGVGAVPVPGTQQHPQAQPGMVPGFSFPTAWGVNDATAQMGVQLGRSAVAAGQDYMEKNVSIFGLVHYLLPDLPAKRFACTVWTTSSPAVYTQASIQRVQSIRTEETSTHTIPMEAQTVDKTCAAFSGSTRRGRPTEVFASSGGLE